jgi:L-fuconolactonase
VTPRVDAHHHLWNLAARDQPWLAGPAMAPLRRDFSLADLAAAMAGSGIDRTVVVQTVADVGETVELLRLATASPIVSGVVGYVDLTAPRLGEQLDRLCAGAGGAHLVGVRSLVQDEPDPEWLLRADVVRGLRAVAARGLAYDLLIKPHHLAAATAVTGLVPEGRFVVDHAAKPAIASGLIEPWATELARLARRPNVWCKLSGLVTEADWSSWSVADLRPYADRVLACFGPQRTLFGTDWPVCTVAASYAAVVRTAEELLDGLPPSDRDAVLGATASDVYRLRHRATSEPASLPA